MSLDKFLEEYSDESKCLQKILELRFPDGIYCPKCLDFTPHYRIKNRKAFGCNLCKHQYYPLKGTIFEKSRTKLTKWFFAIFMMVTTRSGISSKSIQRAIKVTYKTAWAMTMKIRILMSENLGLLKGVVEVDETFVGGKGYNRGKKWWDNWEERPKDIVMGMVERGGRVKTKCIPNTGKWTLLKVIQENIDPTALIISDYWQGYWNLHKHGYRHKAVNHSKHYVDGDTYTQNIENFWSHLKRGIEGVYRQVSEKYLQRYCDEFAFRYNYRKEESKMFLYLLERIGRY